MVDIVARAMAQQALDAIAKLPGRPESEAVKEPAKTMNADKPEKRKKGE